MFTGKLNSLIKASLRYDKKPSFSRVSSDFLYNRTVKLSTGMVQSPRKWHEKIPWMTSQLENHGLQLTFKKNPNLNYQIVCIRQMIAVHGVNEMMTEFSDAEKFEFRHGIDMEVLITPEVIQSETNLNDLSVSERQCVMEDEHELRFFKKYSIQHCEAEYLSLYTLKTCNCVMFYMIRNETMNICGFYDQICVREVETKVRIKGDPAVNLSLIHI